LDKSILSSTNALRSAKDPNVVHFCPSRPQRNSTERTPVNSNCRSYTKFCYRAVQRHCSFDDQLYRYEVGVRCIAFAPMDATRSCNDRVLQRTVLFVFTRADTTIHCIVLVVSRVLVLILVHTCIRSLLHSSFIVLLFVCGGHQQRRSRCNSSSWRPLTLRELKDGGVQRSSIVVPPS
jgi:hypothetical protein